MAPNHKAGWQHLLERDRKNVARIGDFLNKLEDERRANPAIVDNLEYWDKAEKAIHVLTWIYSRPMYSDEETLRLPGVADFRKQVFDMKYKALRAAHRGSNAEAELKELHQSTYADWHLAGLPDEFDIWIEQEGDIGSQRYLEERRRKQIKPDISGR